MRYCIKYNKKQAIVTHNSQKETTYLMKKTGLTKWIVCILAVTLVFLFGGCQLLGLSTGGNDVDPAIYIYQSVIQLEVGQTVQLQVASTENSKIDWVSYDEDIATVKDGLVTAVGVGECEIVAVSDNAMTSITVKVTEQQSTPPVDPDDPDTPVENEVLVLVVSALTLEVGESVTLKATSKLNDTITWNSSVPAVASVDNGVVKALSNGETIITASTSKAQAQCKVTVTDAELGDAAKTGYRLVWRDEFNGNSLDTTKWGYQLGIQDVYGSSYGPEYWGNGELQYYTQDAVSVADGMLKITATKQAMPNGRTYSSARILTRDKASWTYGYFEARMKTPTGNGMWPAFWMLPQPSTTANSNNIYGGWPYNGEIDIMEAKGRLMNKVDTTLHFGPVSDGGWASHYVTKATTLTSNTDEWHTYAVEWTSSYITWYVDGNAVQTVSSSTWYSRSPAAEGNASAPFDQPFYILLNLAVGGQYDGGVQPDGSFTSASMYVDYVRVYEKIA